MNPLRRALVVMGYLSVWNALYATALVVAATQLLGRRHEPIALAGAFFLALGVFLLDRVKPADGMLDPADEAAHPERFAFHRAHARALRVTIVAGTLTGAGCMVLANRPYAAALAVLAPLGVLIYGTVRPSSGVRVKDRPVRKNLAVSLSLASFALLIVLGPTLRATPSIVLDRAPAEVCAFVWIALVVCADAALCDLDDRHTDARFGTRTLANSLPRSRLWVLALVAQIVAAPFACWAAALSRAGNASVIAWWAVAPPATLAIIALWKPSRVREFIDARLAAVGGVAMALQFTPV